MKDIAYCYNQLVLKFGKADAIYENQIVHIIGKNGLSMLVLAGLIESCGKIGGIKLYTLL